MERLRCWSYTPQPFLSKKWEADRPKPKLKQKPKQKQRLNTIFSSVVERQTNAQTETGTGADTVIDNPFPVRGGWKGKPKPEPPLGLFTRKKLVWIVTLRALT